MSAPTKTKVWDYEALGADGKRSKGKLDATSEATAASQLRAQGATPLKISESGRGLQMELTLPGLDRVKVKDLAIFARQFATMNGAGLSLLRSLAILEEQTPNPKLQRAVRDTRRQVEGGTSLSVAMGKHQGSVFPRLMVAMIHAGETGGFLDTALERLAINLENEAKLRAKIKSALTYPKLVLGFSLVMLAGVLLFIVPVFDKMFHQLGGTLPLPTQILVGTSHQMYWLAPLLIALAIAGVILFKRKLRDDYSFRLAFDRFKLRVPVFGPLFTKIAISRFSRNLGTLLQVGVPIMQALDVVGETAGNAVITEAMKDVRKSVREGQTMSGPLSQNSFFPAMVTQMVEVGEESGQISTMLEKIADFYDHEVDAATESLTAAIEPIMVMVMGGIIGVTIVCLYLPMFTIYQHIQGAQ
jgi:type IV pilus assembly protein PilC